MNKLLEEINTWNVQEMIARANQHAGIYNADEKKEYSFLSSAHW